MLKISINKIILIFALLVLFSFSSSASEIEYLLEDADYFFNQKDYEMVIDICGEIIYFDPYNTAAYYYRANSYTALGYYQYAIEDLIVLVNAEPENYQYWGQLGWFLILTANIDDAYQANIKAYQLNPHEYWIVINLGHTFLLSGDKETAREYYQEALPLIPSAEAFQQGPMTDFDIFIDNGWLVDICREEREWMRREYAAISRDDDKQYNNGQDNTTRENLAQELSNKALEYYNQGNISYNQGNIEEARLYLLEALDICLQMEANNIDSSQAMATIYKSLAEVNKELNNYDQALESLMKSLEIDKEYKEAAKMAYDYKEIGRIYIDTKRYSEALEYYQKALQLNKKLGLEEDIASNYNNIGYIYGSMGKYELAIENFKKTMEIYSKLDKQEGIADTYSNIAYMYKNLERYEEALEYYQKSIEIHEGLNKEERLAINYNQVAFIYDNLGNYTAALEYYKKALKVNLKLNSGEAGTNYNNIAAIYMKQGEYEKALKNFEMSLEKNIEFLREGAMITNYNNIGRLFIDLAEYELAKENLQKALEISLRLSSEEGLASIYSNFGILYEKWGQYNKALEYYQQQFQIAKKLNSKGELAAAYNAFGSIYSQLGQYEMALENYQTAFEINKELKKEGELAGDITDIASVYNYCGQYEKALEYYQQALELDIKLNRKADLSRDYNNIGTTYQDLGDYEKALEYVNKALELDKLHGVLDKVAIRYNNLASIYQDIGEYDQVLDYYLKALEIDEKLGKEQNIAIESNNIAYFYYYFQQYELAEKYELKAIDIIEKIRSAAPTDELKRSYLQKQLFSYQILTSIYVRTKQLDKAFNIMELSKAKVLAERLLGREMDLSIPYLMGVQNEMNEVTGLIIYANSNRQDIVELSVTANSKYGIEVSKEDFIKTIMEKYGQEIEKMINEENRIKQLQGLDNVVEQNSFDERFENIIHYYRQQIIQKKDVSEIGKALYKLLIDPCEQQIEDKKELIIVPDGILNYLPFETLIDNKGNYLLEKYKIRYIQSETIAKIIKDRNYSEDRRTILAFGGAVYNSSEYNNEVIQNSRQLANLKNQVDQVLDQRGKVDKYYSQLGYGNWDNLPGTLAEVNSISQIIADAEVVTGEQVNEGLIKESSLTGKLAAYRILHFATHGIVVPEVPELSAVVLSLTREKGIDESTLATTEDLDQEDGYLRMGEIVDLNIRADFVNLSACETGLGKIYAGEGVVGLTQSFLLAGANSLSVSLWSVADESTAKFMIALYKLVEKEGLSYAEAMNEVKLMFLQGDFGEQYQQPYYWAPFIYYGK